MYKFYLAWKFFFSRRINLMSVIGIAVGVWLLTVVPSVMNGFVHEQKQLIRGTLSDLLISPLALQDADGKLEYPPYDRYAKALGTVTDIEAFAPRILWVGIFGTAGTGNRLLSTANQNWLGLNFVEIAGVDAEAEKRVARFEEYLKNEPLPGGRRVKDTNNPFAIPLDEISAKNRLEAEARGVAAILPESLYREIGLNIGERIMLQTVVFPEESLQDGAGEDDDEPRKVSRKPFVAGSYRTGEYDIDFPRVYLKRDALQEMLGLDRDFTVIAVKLRGGAKASVVKEELRERLSRAGLPSTVQTWEDQRSVLLRAVNNERGILISLLSAVILVAGVNIFVILSLVVNQKVRDIGVVGALGATRGGVLSLFLGVGAFTGVFGEILGGTLGYLTVKYLTPFEMFLRDYFGIVLFDPHVYAFDHLPVLFSWPWFIALLIVTMIACLIASLIPAARAARMDPVEALRYE